VTFLAPDELARHVSRPGFLPLDDWRIVTLVAVLWQESRGDTMAVGRPVHVAVNGVPTPAVALGLCQLLTASHVDRGPFPDVPRLSVADCFDAELAWQRMWLVMNRGRTGWSYNLAPWSAYTSGAYKPHLPLALEAVRAIGGRV
jgi:hypothetical protein